MNLILYNLILKINNNTSQSLIIIRCKLIEHIGRVMRTSQKKRGKNNTARKINLESGRHKTLCPVYPRGLRTDLCGHGVQPVVGEVEFPQALEALPDASLAGAGDLVAGQVERPQVGQTGKRFRGNHGDHVVAHVQLHQSTLNSKLFCSL